MIIFQGEPHHDLVRDVRQNKGSILKVGRAVTGRYMLDLTTCNLALGKCRVHKETKEGDCREESLRREVSNSGCCFFSEVSFSMGNSRFCFSFVLHAETFGSNRLHQLPHTGVPEQKVADKTPGNS